MNHLNKNVSCFQCAYTKEPPKDVNLITWLTSQKYRYQVIHLRTHQKDVQKVLKLQLPAITVSGTFASQDTNSLINYTGLMALDIDDCDIETAKKKLIKLPCIAYCGLSCSGRGLWCIVPVTPDVNNYKPHFEAIRKEMEGYNIKLDNLSDILRFRYYSIDDNAYFNPYAEIYTDMVIRETPISQSGVGDMYTIVHNQITILEQKNADICENYNGWIRMGAALNKEFGENGLSFFERLSKLRPGDSTAAKHNEVLKAYRRCANMNSITIKTFFHHAKQYIL